MTDRVAYAHDAPRRLRAAFIGCGGHAFRNVLPALRFLPVELAAVCDRDESRAKAFAQTFGAGSVHTDHRDMLEREALECVFVVTGYDRDTLAPTYPAIADACLRAGVHTWIEKPPVGSLDDVALLHGAVQASGRTLAVGFKKAFAPANVRLREIVASEEFGDLDTLTLRYPQRIPSVEEFAGADAGSAGARLVFLDHICHPLSVLRLIAGPASAMSYTRAAHGGGVATFTMACGAVAALHLAAGQSAQSPLERTEAVGRAANAVVENGTRLTYYRRVSGRVRPYGDGADFTSGMDDAPLVWEPEWSLGTLYNKSMFLLGYYGELRHFCDAALAGRPVEVGGLDYAEEGIRIHDAFKAGPGVEVAL